MSASEFPIQSAQYVDRNQNSFRPTHFSVTSPAIIVVVVFIVIIIIIIIIIIMQSVLRQAHNLLQSEIFTQCYLVFQFQILVSSLFFKGTQ